jgi:hypothetical protein
MPYYENLKLLFIHIPKTGGSDFNSYLESTGGRVSLIGTPENTLFNSSAVSLQHRTFSNLYRHKNALNLDFERIRLIAFVRNPYDRVISDLFYLKLADSTDSPEKCTKALQFYFLYSSTFDNHKIPQYKFITHNKKIVKSIKIYRTENLTKELQPDFPDYKGKDTSHTYREYLTSESIRLINAYYKKDFEIFGYTVLAC